MKEYRVRYSIGAHVYVSTICTSSTNAVFLWVETIGGANPKILDEMEIFA